ncbi:MAG: hypothetical protein JO113_08630 [Candidatus Eremiobacteraeota bacterium]|nr:hypothetical protein [Candidatus Eremiobacteraeota bacterium]
MLGRFALICAALPLLLTATPALALETPGQKIIVHGGTAITVVVTNPISSSTAKVGDTFAIESQSDVVIDGWIAISKGAPGQGTITSVDHAGSHGHPGSLGIEMNWIYAVDGEKVRLTSQNVNEEGESKAGVSSTVTIISWATLGLAGLFAHNFVKGRDVTVDDTHPLKAYVDDSVYIVANTRASDSDGGFAKAVGGSTSTPVAHSSPPPN